MFECPSLAADLSDNNSTVLSREVLKNAPALPKTIAKTNTKPRETSVAAGGQSTTDHESQPEDCNDECLCHITPIQGLAFVMPKDYLRPSVSPVKPEFQLSSDLPPPYQPPRLS